MENVGQSHLNQLWQRAIYGLRNADWQAQLGLGMLLVAACLAVVIFKQNATQHQLHIRLAQLPAAPVVAHPNKTDDLVHTFYQILPPQSKVDGLSASIFEAADGLGLRFDHAGFSNTSTDTGLVLSQIKLPVKGTYMQVRQFLNALLNAHPTLALDSIKVQRDDVYADTVQADLVFVLYLRGGDK